MKDSFTTYADAEKDHTVKEGDKAEIDFDGFDEGGAPIDGTSSKNHPLIIGSKSFIPGFEEEIIGLKEGEKKEFNITFPADYHEKSFQKKKVTFKITVQKILIATKPELNEDLIQKAIGEKKSVEEFKKWLTEMMEQERKHKERMRQETAFMDELVKKSKIELPPQLVEEEIDMMMDEVKQDLAQRGLDFTHYLEHLKKTEQDIRDERKDDAVKRLTIRFALHNIFDTEKIEPDEKAISKEIELMSARYAPNQREQFIKDANNKDADIYKRIVNKVKLDTFFNKYLPTS